MVAGVRLKGEEQTREYWDRKWAREDGDRRDIPRHLDRLGVDLSDRMVLDIGCGKSKDDAKLRDRGAFVVPVDFSEAACRFQSKRGVAAVCGDAQRLPFKSECFDVVVASHVLEHLTDLHVVGEWMRVLRPGGVMLILGPHGMGWDTRCHEHFWTFEHDQMVHFLFQFSDCVTFLRPDRYDELIVAVRK